MPDEVYYPEHDPNKKTAVQVWEERYAGEGFLFGREPSDFLKHYVDHLKKGRTLDIAMGEGQNAAFLAGKGFQVEGIDGSAKAIEKAKRLAGEKNVTVEAKTQNLDFFLMPLMKYDTILMMNFKPLPRFFSEVRRGLVLGGTFLLESYTVEHYKIQNPASPILDFDQCYKPNEVLSHLREFNVLFYKELREGSSHRVQVIAQKHKT